MSAPPPRSLRPLRRALSAPRLEGYRLGATETDLDLLARYAWNLALAEALYPALHYLEVVLRNALHSALARVHGDRWYVGPEVLVGAYVQDEVQRVLARVPDPLAPDAPDRVVAALPFGFWTTLLSKPYGRPPSRRRVQHPLWPALLPATFPAFSGSASLLKGRAAVAKRFEDVRRLRNRVFHHEPIWRGRPDALLGRVVPIAEQHQETLEALAWMSPAVRDALARVDRFPAVHRQGAAAFRALLAGLP